METTMCFVNLGVMFIPGLVIGLIIMIPLILLVVCYRVLAPKNIFFTFGRENRAMFIMTGKKFSGRVILPSKTLYCDSSSYDIRPLQRGMSGSSSILGMYWIGLYPFNSIYERHQQWLEWKSDSQGVRQIEVRDEMTPYLICKPFEYAMTLEAGEDKDGVPLNVYFTVILVPTNAILPVFGNDNAYGQVQTLCRAQVLLLVKQKTFSNLGMDKENDIPDPDEELDEDEKEKKRKISHDEFSDQICQLNRRIPGRPDHEGLPEILGYRILDAKLDSIEITGPHKDILLTASTAKFKAEAEADALVAQAEGIKKATVKKAEGEQEAMILKANGEKQSIEIIAAGNKIAGILNIDVEKYSMDKRKEFYEAIKGLDFAQQIELAKKMFEDSKLTTFVSGKDVLPTVNLGGN